MTNNMYLSNASLRTRPHQMDIIDLVSFNRSFKFIIDNNNIGSNIYDSQVALRKLTDQFGQYIDYIDYSIIFSVDGYGRIKISAITTNEALIDDIDENLANKIYDAIDNCLFEFTESGYCNNSSEFAETEAIRVVISSDDDINNIDYLMVYSDDVITAMNEWIHSSINSGKFQNMS